MVLLHAVLTAFFLCYPSLILVIVAFLSLYVLQEVEYVGGDGTVSSGRGLHQG